MLLSITKVLFLSLLILAVGLPAFASQFTGEVIGVLDGDTIDVLIDRKPIRVRLHGIDCPEKGQPRGSRAKWYASDLAFKKTVTVQITDVDRYGRIVGQVILPDGKCQFDLVPPEAAEGMRAAASASPDNSVPVIEDFVRGMLMAGEPIELRMNS